MNIIVGEENLDNLHERFLTLELDSFYIPGSPKPVKTYALIDNLSFNDMYNVEQFKNLHIQLIENYRLKNWDYCEETIDKLLGAWKGELDSFYTILSERISSLKSSDLNDDWDGTIVKV